MTFPTANSTIIRNEDGEPLGFETDYGYEPDYDPAADLYGDDYDPADDYWGDEAACKEAGFHGNDGEGTDRENIFTCKVCGEEFEFTD